MPRNGVPFSRFLLLLLIEGLTKLFGGDTSYRRSLYTLSCDVSYEEVREAGAKRRKEVQAGRLEEVIYVSLLAGEHYIYIIPTYRYRHKT